jgi:hypothetical protein
VDGAITAIFKNPTVAGGDWNIQNSSSANQRVLGSVEINANQIANFDEFIRHKCPKILLWFEGGIAWAYTSRGSSVVHTGTNNLASYLLTPIP